ncbi:DUF6290 family protein [Proteus mirabilis]|uniref:plasmid mobilization protein MobA n=1 Tax=Proteus mirabilis TaxID=584 RepID=UPI00214FC8B0|nr:plasmid mobilization protein MobA [Proteus mirabilis]MCS6722770.1 DUF6290 family protein [Proteus mirabilis]MCS6729773.1 DUF6290 family protein [Proteus mirabilis]MCS6742395.1 DUF6290 family protein [Acinetobacter baumannii]MCS6748725.1 DUF6290 family protein [Proteus mirabilis]
MSSSESRKTDSVIVIRCNKETKKLIKDKAELAGVSMSSFMLSTALSKKIKNRSDYKALGEINRIAALQKHLFNEGKRVGDKEFSEVLVKLKEVSQLLIEEIEKNDT